MKKLLFVGPYPPPYGGIASHLADLLPALADRGYEVTSLSQANYDNIETYSGMKNIHFVAMKNPLRNLWFFISMFIMCLNLKKGINWTDYLRYVNLASITYKVIKQNKSEIVFIYELELGAIIPFLRRRMGDFLPIVLTIYGSLYTNSKDFLKYYEFNKEILMSSNMLLSSSCYCAKSVNQVLGINVPVSPIYVGVDIKIYHPENQGHIIRQELGIPPTATVFLFFGRMDKDMGLNHVLAAANNLLNLNSNVYIILAGAKGKMSKKAEELAVREPRVKYCPDIPNEKKSLYYAACDVLLALTMEKRACMGVSIKEAMASGKPVIASTSGGIPEAIEDNINGYLIDIDEAGLDWDKFFAAAKTLVSDPNIGREMGIAGRQKAVILFSNEVTVEKYLNVINQL